MQYPKTRIKKNANNIEDIYDGLRYRKLIQDGFFDGQYNISFQGNTDGVSLFKSSSFEIWPIFLKINELYPNLRY